MLKKPVHSLSQLNPSLIIQMEHIPPLCLPEVGKPVCRGGGPDLDLPRLVTILVSDLASPKHRDVGRLDA